MFTFITLALALSVSARPTLRANVDVKQNGLDAMALNDKFASLTPDSPCKTGENACVNNQFAQCVNDKFVLQSCGSANICAALPLVNSAGTSITCTTKEDRDARIAAATGSASGNGNSQSNNDNNNNNSGNAGDNQNDNGNGNTGSAGDRAAGNRGSGDRSSNNNNNSGNGNNNSGNGNNNNGNGNNGQNNGNNGQNNGNNGQNNGNNGQNNGNDGQNNGNNGQNNGNNSNNNNSQQCLDPSVIASDFNNDGTDSDDKATPSLTSSNNFINFCSDFNQFPITNGKQIQSGSCNPAPMGLIPSTQNMPASKFQSPKNFQKVKPNQAFTVRMKIKNLDTGFFVNAKNNYFSAPQQLNDNGVVQGHSHIVIQKIQSYDSTDVLDANEFAFFVGLNDKAQNGVLSAEVTKGLPEGFYKLSSINTAANHQPLLVPIAQHGSLDDVVYFEVSNDANNDNGNGNNNNNNGNGNNNNNGNRNGNNNGNNNNNNNGRN
ncbi:hypothetical protein VNI00_000994 [Paramarasmius palmivorus]|uniref:Uncharacterized protein n=1 Tax=Paramarasmius palmivorus TaxID=297713 RepID=A0AAW0E8A6_9AGAR